MSRTFPEAHRLDPTAHIHPSVKLAPGVCAGPWVVIAEETEIGANSILHSGVVLGRGCKLGEEVILHTGVVLYDDCVLGNRVVVHSNVVIGSDGFGYRRQADRHVKVPQLGWVEIEDDVEIGARTTIDRGTFGPTRIGRGTKLDTAVMIGHNCRIGAHNAIATQVGVAGSTSTGESVVIGERVGVVGHIHIGDRVVVAGRTGVSKTVPADATMTGVVWGLPARPNYYVEPFGLMEDIDAFRKDVRRVKTHMDADKAA